MLVHYQMEELEKETPGMSDIPRNYEAKHHIMRISTRSTKLSVPLDIQHIAERGQESSSYQMASDSSEARCTKQMTQA